MRAILLAAFSTALLSVNSAQATSCSDYKSICVSRAKNTQKCDGAWKQCMRTGIYIGPESGTNHGQADKR